MTYFQICHPEVSLPNSVRLFKLAVPDLNQDSAFFRLQTVSAASRCLESHSYTLQWKASGHVRLLIEGLQEVDFRGLDLAGQFFVLSAPLASFSLKTPWCILILYEKLLKGLKALTFSVSSKC
jgi:hypothetical protein